MVRSTSVPNLVLWISFEIGNVASDPKDPWSSRPRQQSHRQMWKRQYIPFDNPRQFQHAMVKSRRRKIHREDLLLEMQIFWKWGFEFVAMNEKRWNKHPSTQTSLTQRRKHTSPSPGIDVPQMLSDAILVCPDARPIPIFHQRGNNLIVQTGD